MKKTLIYKVVGHLDDAFEHIRRSSSKKWHNDDIWDLGHAWQRRRAEISSQLLQQSFVFSPYRAVEYEPGKTLNTFRTVDKLVLKAISLELINVLPRSRLCFSYKGHGGVAGALQAVGAVNNVKFGFKTDVKDYYATISHPHLMLMLSPYLDCSTNRLIYNALQMQEKGLPRGSAMSHVLGNFYLHNIDSIFEKRRTQFYIRYMDDILILTRSRGALRRSVATVKKELELLGLSTSLPKQWIGKVSPNAKHMPNFLGKALLVSSCY